MIQFKNERLTEIYRLSDNTFYDLINTIYQFIKTFLDKKCLFLRNMEPLRGIEFISGDATHVKIVLPPFWKGVYSRRKGFVPREQIHPSLPPPPPTTSPPPPNSPPPPLVKKNIGLLPFLRGVFPKRNECVPLVSKFFPFRIDPFSEGKMCRKANRKLNKYRPCTK